MLRKRVGLVVLGVSACVASAVLAQTLPPELQPITPSNAAQVVEATRIEHEDNATIVWTPGGTGFAVGSRGGVLLYDLDSLDAPVMLAEEDPLRVEYSVSFSARGTLLAAGNSHNMAQVWDLESGESQILQQGDSAAYGVTFSPDGATIALPKTGNTIALWDVESGAARAEVSGTERLAFSPDSRLLATIDSNLASVLVYDASSGEPYAVIEAEQPPVGAIAFSPDGATLAYGAPLGRAGAVYLWDVVSKTGRAAGEFPIGSVSQLAFSPDSGLVAAGASNDLRIALIDAQTGATRSTITTTDSVLWLAFSPYGQVLASAGTTAVSLWDVAGGELLSSFDLSNQRQYPISGLAFSPRGTLLLAAALRGPIVLLGTTAEAPAEELEVPVSAVTCTLTAPSNVNLRDGAGTNFNHVGSLLAGQTAVADGQLRGGDGLIWYRLTDDTYARSDVVIASDECENLPVVG